MMPDCVGALIAAGLNADLARSICATGAQVKLGNLVIQRGAVELPPVIATGFLDLRRISNFWAEKGDFESSATNYRLRGLIFAGQATTVAVGAFGFAHFTGGYVDLANGDYGVFDAWGYAIGFDVSGAINFGYSSSMNAFTGVSVGACASYAAPDHIAGGGCYLANSQGWTAMGGPAFSLFTGIGGNLQAGYTHVHRLGRL
jgi:hypothetical protein